MHTAEVTGTAASAGSSTSPGAAVTGSAALTLPSAAAASPSREASMDPSQASGPTLAALATAHCRPRGGVWLPLRPHKVSRGSSGYVVLPITVEDHAENLPGQHTNDQALQSVGSGLSSQVCSASNASRETIHTLG